MPSEYGNSRINKMFKGNAVLTATIAEKEYKRQFEKSFPVAVADLFAKEFTGTEISLTPEQKATVAALEQSFPAPEQKDPLKATAVKDGDKELSQHEIGVVIEYYVHPALRPAFHAINAKFDVEQRSVARAELEKELGVAKPKKTVKADSAVIALAEVLFSAKMADSMEVATTMAKAKLGIS